MDSANQLFRAASIVPMTGHPIRNGGILVEEKKVKALGNFEDLARDNPDAQLVDRPQCTIVPGLVNAHAHLELSEFTRGPKPESFTQWLSRLVPQGQVTAQSVAESVARSVPKGIQECLRFGVTSVGDISRHCGVSRPLLKSGPLRVVSYGEVQAMAQRRGFLEERIATATDRTLENPEFLTIALTPHAPYSIELEGYKRCVEVARSMKMPLATHLAETPDEATFLADHTGPFRDLWSYIGAWDQDVPRFAGSPIRFAKAAGLLDYPTLLAHVNYCDDAEMELLARSQASVVYCPRTHAYFAHPPHRWRDMLSRAINVALGTDSCASSPNLNLLDDMRLIRQIAPEVAIESIWEMATVRAARAIGAEQKVGSLGIGKWADLVVFETNGRNPLAEILDEGLMPVETYVGGTRAI